MISESFLEQLKYSSDIEQIISSYVNLRRKGRTLSGLCPFHSEKTPSFTVYPENQSWYCFGCGQGGDVITFVKQAEHLEYVDAVKFLAQRAGMPMPEDQRDDGASRLKTRILEMNRTAARWFHANLADKAVGRPAAEYLTRREILPKTARRFGLGWAPDSWEGLTTHLRDQGFSFDEMRAAALAQQGKKGSHYDAFRGRLMFPIIDLRGNVVGFGGRTLGDSGPKYLNSADTPVFKKSRELYALNLAKQSGSNTLVLAEGYMDVIAIHQAGFSNAVATLGTALTPDQARLVSRYANQVVIAYDSDEAGQKATKRAIELFSQTDVTVRVLELQGAKDPDEYIKKYGAQRFENLLQAGKGAVRFEIDRIRKKHDLDDAQGRVSFLREFCKLMADIPDELQREVYVTDLARELEIGKEAILSNIASIRKSRYQARKKKDSHNLRPYAQANAVGSVKKRPIADPGLLVAQEKLIALLWQHPDYIANIRSRITAEDFFDPDLQNIFAAILELPVNGQPPELIQLSGLLDTHRMGILTRLIVTGQDIQYLPAQAEEFIRVIKQAGSARKPEEVAEMSPEEYKAYITSLAAGKK